MSPQTIFHSPYDRPTASLHAPCNERAAALDLLHAFSIAEACNLETWLDRIESRNGRELRS